MSASSTPTAPLGSERQREVHRGRRLAHPALAARDGDDVLHAGDELHAALHRVRRDLLGQIDRDPADRRHGGERVTDEFLQMPVLTLRRIADDDVDRDIVPVDLHPLYRLRRNEIAVGEPVDDGSQPRENVGFGERHGVPDGVMRK